MPGTCSVDVDSEVLPLLLVEVVAGGEVALLVQLLEGGNDALAEHALAGAIAEDVCHVVEVDLKDLLCGLGLQARGVDEGCYGVCGIRVGLTSRSLQRHRCRNAARGSRTWVKKEKKIMFETGDTFNLLMEMSETCDISV